MTPRSGVRRVPQLRAFAGGEEGLPQAALLPRLRQSRRQLRGRERSLIISNFKSLVPSVCCFFPRVKYLCADLLDDLRLEPQ